MFFFFPKLTIIIRVLIASCFLFLFSVFGTASDTFSITHRHVHYIIPLVDAEKERRTTGRPGSSEVPRNPLTRWDVSSIPANGIFLIKKIKNKNKNAQRVEDD